MPTNKKQHFVPKFHLRNFSINKEEREIGVFIISNNKFIEKGDLGNQAKKDWFYGKDLKFEGALGIIEDQSSEILKSIISSNKIPQRGTELSRTLTTFVCLLAKRTELAGETLNEGIDALMKQAYSENLEGEDLDSIRVRVKNGIQVILQTAAETSPILYDLNYNRTFAF